MGPKRKCVFSEKLQSEYKFLKACENSSARVRCLSCSSEFSIEYRGRLDIEDHVKSGKHKKAVSAASSANIASFFKNKNAGDKELQCAAREAAFAYHTAKHELSFKTSDCTSQLIKKLFEPKFAAARTKTEAIIVRVISPYISDELLRDLKNVNYITVFIDSSNKKDVKLTPVVVRYFTLNNGVNIKLLNFEEVPGETSEILLDHILKGINKWPLNLESKIVGLCADNTNTNFGGVHRHGQGNVFRKLQAKLERPILGIGCSAHIAHNAVQTACDVLPVDIEAIVVKLYKYFYQYTVRVTEMKEFCDFASVEFKRLLSHGSTRFLSLMPAIERILLQFKPLKMYFLANEHSPKLMVDFFSSPVNELYLMFVHGSLQMFQKTILKLEREDITASEASLVYLELVRQLEERKSHVFVPFAAKQILNQLKIEGEVEEGVFFESVTGFYDAGINYLKLWGSSFDRADKFSWLSLKSEDVTWTELEECGLTVNKIVPNSVNMDQLFDEKTLCCDIISKLKPKWEALPEEEKPKTQEKWKEVFESMSKCNIEYQNIFKLVEFGMCLPGTSAPVERVFSIMGNVWCAERGRMSISVVRELLNIKVNSKLSCVDFYDKIKSDKVFLGKVLSSEKYNLRSDEDQESHKNLGESAGSSK